MKAKESDHLIEKTQNAGNELHETVSMGSFNEIV